MPLKGCSELAILLAKRARLTAADPDVKSFRDVAERIVARFNDPQIQVRDVEQKVLEFQEANRKPTASEESKKVARIMREPAAKAKLARETEAMKAELESGNVAPREPHSRVYFDKDHEMAVAKRDVLARKIRQHLEAQKPITKFGLAKVPFAITSTLNLGGEASFVLLQGGKSAGMHPLMAARNIAKTIEAFKSEEGQARVEREIRNRPNAAWYDIAKVALTDPSGARNTQDEMYLAHIGKWVKERADFAHNPAVKKTLETVGEWFDKFDRSQQTYLNLVRADTFDLNAEKMFGGVLDRKRAEYIAHWTNAITGRGDLSYGTPLGTVKFQQLGDALATVALAPRYYTGELQSATLEPLLYSEAIQKLSPADRAIARKQGAKEIARLAVSISAVVAGLLAFGWKVEFYPGSAMFGKAVKGNKVMDIPMMGPIARYYNLAWKVLYGEKFNTRGGGYQKLGAEDKLKEAVRFGRYRQSTGLRLVGDPILGQNAIGQPVNFTTKEGLINYSKNFWGPITYRDIVNQMKDSDDIPEDLALSILAFFGTNLQKYEDEPRTSDYSLQAPSP